MQIDLERDLAADVYLSEAPPFLSFCMGWSCNFVGSESGQIQSVKQDSKPPPPPSSHTLCLYILYFDSGKGGGGVS